MYTKHNDLMLSHFFFSLDTCIIRILCIGVDHIEIYHLGEN